MTRRLLGTIRDEQIPGVVWISGDVHWGAVAKVGQPGEAFEDQWEVFAGPAGSTINPGVFVVKEGDHYTRVVRNHNWVRFEADPQDGTLRVAFIGKVGAVMAEQTLQL